MFSNKHSSGEIFSPKQFWASKQGKLWERLTLQVSSVFGIWSLSSSCIWPAPIAQCGASLVWISELFSLFCPRATHIMDNFRSTWPDWCFEWWRGWRISVGYVLFPPGWVLTIAVWPNKRFRAKSFAPQCFNCYTLHHDFARPQLNTMLGVVFCTSVEIQCTCSTEKWLRAVQCIRQKHSSQIVLVRFFGPSAPLCGVI